MDDPSAEARDRLLTLAYGLVLRIRTFSGSSNAAVGHAARATDTTAKDLRARFMRPVLSKA